MDSAPNFEMAFREIKTNWKEIPPVFLWSAGNFPSQKWSQLKKPSYRIYKALDKIWQEDFILLINEGEYSTFLQEWTNKPISKN